MSLVLFQILNGLIVLTFPFSWVLQITAVTWTEFLCVFLEMIGLAELTSHISTIKRGHYGLLDIHVKLEILRELITQCIETDLFREKMEECIEERQALAAKKRVEAIEEGRKRREEKERLKMEPNGNEVEKITMETVAKDSIDNQSGECKKNGNVSKQVSAGSSTPQQNQSSENRFYFMNGFVYAEKCFIC